MVLGFFEEEWQASQQHGQDPLSGPLFVVGGLET